jgi:hypothetical protein
MNIVKAVRLQKRIKKNDILALSAGILTDHRLRMIEAGKGRPPKVDEQVALSHILNVPVEKLFPEPKAAGILRRPYR